MKSDRPSPEREALAIFRAHSGPVEKRDIPVASPVVQIGQGPRNDIVLDDDSVSTRHARLEFLDGGWMLTDLGSRNGTFVEGNRLAPEVPTPLPQEAMIAMGVMKFTFHRVEGADADGARADYAPPALRTPLKERSGTRLPVWVAALALLVVVILLVILFFTFGSDPQTIQPIAEPITLLLHVEPLRLAS